MNAVRRREPQSTALMNIIELKWLMAGDGHRVHVERLQSDRGYALECLAIAAKSPRDAVRCVAARLRALLGLEAGAVCDASRTP